jgi:hypothetical protein
VVLPPIVVRPKSEAFSSDNSSGPSAERQGAEVMLINRENNFVIVNLGEDSGIKVGDTMQVFSGTKAIAVIEVIQIRKVFSACDIKREDSPIKIGDTVK